jgi:hypothetical protein
MTGVDGAVTEKTRTCLAPKPLKSLGKKLEIGKKREKQSIQIIFNLSFEILM